MTTHELAAADLQSMREDVYKMLIRIKKFSPIPISMNVSDALKAVNISVVRKGIKELPIDKIRDIITFLIIRYNRDPIGFAYFTILFMIPYKTLTI